jgi:hypothetical protein
MPKPEPKPRFECTFPGCHRRVAEQGKRCMYHWNVEILPLPRDTGQRQDID